VSAINLSIEVLGLIPARIESICELGGLNQLD